MRRRPGRFGQISSRQADTAIPMGNLFEFAANHPLLVSATIAMALVVVFYELRQKAGSIAALGPSQAVRLINGGAKIVDIRSAENFAQGHIVDAVNIAADELNDYLDKKLKAAKSILIVCDTGTRSGQAVTGLRRKGNEKVFNLQGGITAWRNENLPIVSAD